jgi:DNA invertase Pin-like site-specific DNA recombinase
VVAVMPWEHTGSKIAARHRERLAVVYVRQSTRQQVVGHQESTRLQYALVDRAVALGWEACRVVLIDDDLGKSGSSAEHRVGFQRLVAEISLGHVGLVLGTEMSRLARSGKDWYQLLELCALGGSLLADADGVYDPTEYNDRLLLGLKGTMSEAELYLINQRMRAGRVNKARRGELAIALPVGYWRHPRGRQSLTPTSRCRAWSGWSLRSSRSSALSRVWCGSWWSTASSSASALAVAPTRARSSGSARPGRRSPAWSTARSMPGSTSTAAG